MQHKWKPKWDEEEEKYKDMPTATADFKLLGVKSDLRLAQLQGKDDKKYVDAEKHEKEAAKTAEIEQAVAKGENIEALVSREFNRMFQAKDDKKDKPEKVEKQDDGEAKKDDKKEASEEKK